MTCARRSWSLPIRSAGRERVRTLLTFAMQKVEGSSPFVRSRRDRRRARLGSAAPRRCRPSRQRRAGSSRPARRRVPRGPSGHGSAKRSSRLCSCRQRCTAGRQDASPFRTLTRVHPQGVNETESTPTPTPTPTPSDRGTVDSRKHEERVVRPSEYDATWQHSALSTTCVGCQVAVRRLVAGRGTALVGG